MVNMINKKMRRIIKRETEKFNVKEIVVDKIMEGKVFIICDPDVEKIYCKMEDCSILEICGIQIHLSGKRGEKLSVLFVKKDEGLKEILYTAGREKEDGVFGGDENDTLFNNLVGMVFEKDIITDKMVLSYMIAPKEGLEGKKLRRYLLRTIGDMLPDSDNLVKQFEEKYVEEKMNKMLMMGLMEMGIKSKEKKK